MLPGVLWRDHWEEAANCSCCNGPAILPANPHRLMPLQQLQQLPTAPPTWSCAVGRNQDVTLGLSLLICQFPSRVILSPGRTHRPTTISDNALGNCRSHCSFTKSVSRRSRDPLAPLSGRGLRYTRVNEESLGRHRLDSGGLGDERIGKAIQPAARTQAPHCFRHRHGCCPQDARGDCCPRGARGAERRRSVWSRSAFFLRQTIWPGRAFAEAKQVFDSEISTSFGERRLHGRPMTTRMRPCLPYPQCTGASHQHIRRGFGRILVVMGHKEGILPSAPSGGQAQRICIARALARKPCPFLRGGRRGRHKRAVGGQ